jgi:hypothetical protein
MERSDSLVQVHMHMQMQVQTKAYIIYVLNNLEEYVVGVNPWVTYDRVKQAYIELTCSNSGWRVYDGHSLPETMDYPFKIGEHLQVVIQYAGNIVSHGYIARVA